MTFYHWTSPGLLPLIQKHGLRPTQGAEIQEAVVWLTTDPTIAIREDLTQAELLQARFPFHDPVRLTVRVAINSSRLAQFRKVLLENGTDPVIANFYPDTWYVYGGTIAPNKIGSPVEMTPPVPPGMNKDVLMARYAERVAAFEKGILERRFPEYVEKTDAAKEG